MSDVSIMQRKLDTWLLKGHTVSIVNLPGCRVIMSKAIQPIEGQTRNAVAVLRFHRKNNKGIHMKDLYRWLIGLHSRDMKIDGVAIISDVLMPNLASYGLAKSLIEKGWTLVTIEKDEFFHKENPNP